MPFDLKSLASGAFRTWVSGMWLGGKSPLDWGVVKMAETMLAPFASALPGGGNMSLPGGGGFNLGSMSGMMPSIVKMVAQSSEMVPLARSTVGTSLAPADQMLAEGEPSTTWAIRSISMACKTRTKFRR
jgi:hypothetical protein